MDLDDLTFGQHSVKSLAGSGCPPGYRNELRGPLSDAKKRCGNDVAAAQCLVPALFNQILPSGAVAGVPRHCWLAIRGSGDYQFGGIFSGDLHLSAPLHSGEVGFACDHQGRLALAYLASGSVVTLSPGSGEIWRNRRLRPDGSFGARSAVQGTAISGYEQMSCDGVEYLRRLGDTLPD